MVHRVFYWMAGIETFKKANSDKLSTDTPQTDHLALETLKRLWL